MYRRNRIYVLNRIAIWGKVRLSNAVIRLYCGNYPRIAYNMLYRVAFLKRNIAPKSIATLRKTAMHIGSVIADEATAFVSKALF